MNALKAYFNITNTETGYIKAVWILAVLVLIETCFNLDPTTDAIFTSVVGIVIFILLLLDRKALRLAGIKPPHWGWALIDILYMFKRDKAVGKTNRRQATAFLILTLVTGVVSVGLSMVESTADIATSSCNVINTIDGLKRQQISCVRVTDVEKLSTDWYQGNVLLSNGDTYKVMTHDLNDGNITVQLH